MEKDYTEKNLLLLFTIVNLWNQACDSHNHMVVVITRLFVVTTRVLTAACDNYNLVVIHKDEVVVRFFTSKYLLSPQYTCCHHKSACDNHNHVFSTPDMLVTNTTLPIT